MSWHDHEDEAAAMTPAAKPEKSKELSIEMNAMAFANDLDPTSGVRWSAAMSGYVAGYTAARAYAQALLVEKDRQLVGLIQQIDTTVTEHEETSQLMRAVVEVARDKDDVLGSLNHSNCSCVRCEAIRALDEHEKNK